MHKKTLKLSAKTLAFLMLLAVFLFLFKTQTQAAVGLSVGNSTLNLGSTENLFYGNIGATSHASSSFLLFQKNSADIFKVDSNGNLTTSGAISASALSGAITSGSINAANVSAGSFGANVAGGNYSFPGSVGIGTTAPSKKLEIAGDTLITTTSSSQPLKAYQATYLNFSVDYPSSPSIYTTQINFGLLGRLQYDGNGGVMNIENRSTQASSNLRFVMGATERLRITSTGNVGIGAVSPNGKLVIEQTQTTNASTFTNPHLKLTSTSGTTNNGGTTAITLSTSVADNYGISLAGLRAGTGGAPDFVIRTHNNNAEGDERIRVTSIGNVGVGTSTPGTRLTVIGDGTYSIDAGNYRIGNVAAPSNPLDVVNLSYLESSILAATSSIATLWGGSTSGNIWNANSGNVGIGTTNPTFKLTVVGGVRVDGISADLEVGTNGWMYHGGNYWQYPNGNDYYLGTRNIASGKLNLITNNIERITIDNNGNVGIGTTTPVAKLDVNGFVAIRSTTGLVMYDSSGYGAGRIFSSYYFNNGDILLQPGSSTSTTAMFSPNGGVLIGTNISARPPVDGMIVGGNVGIGITNPNALLDVNGLAKMRTSVITQDEDIVNKGYLVSTLDAFGSENLYWKLNGSNLYASTTTWNVGIGLSNPTAKLHINDNTVTSGRVTDLFSNSITSGRFINLNQTTSAFTGTGMYMDFASNSTADFLDFRRAGGQLFEINYKGGIRNTYVNHDDYSNLNYITYTSGHSSANGASALYTSGASTSIQSSTASGSEELFDNQYEGFKFNSGAFSYMNGAYVRLRRNNNTPGNLNARVTLRIYTDNGGQPGTYVTQSSYVYLNRIGTSFGNQYFSLARALTPNTDYWLVLYKYDFSTTDEVYFSVNGTGNNEWAYGDGSNWSVDASKKGYYNVYTRSPRGVYANSDASEALYGNSTFSSGVRANSVTGYGLYATSNHNYSAYFNGGAGIYNSVNNPSATAIYNWSTYQRSGSRYADLLYNTAFNGTALSLNLSSNVYTTYYYQYDGSTFNDLSTTARSAGGSYYTMLNDSNDYFYFGRSSSTTSYRNLFFDIYSTPNMSGLTWEHANGADGSGNCTWSTFTPTLDETNGLTRDGMVTPGSVSLVSCKVNGQSGYWMRISASSVTTPLRAYASSFGFFSGNFADFLGSNTRRFRIDYTGSVQAASEIYPGTTDDEDGTQTSYYLYYDGGSSLAFNTPVIVGAPVLATHAVTKSYVDEQIASSTGAISFWGGSAASNIWSLNSGNVGIGTTNPGDKLDISGSMRITASSGSYLDRYAKFTQSGNDGSPLSLSFGGTGTASYLDIQQSHPYYGFLMHKGSVWGGQGIQGTNNDFVISTGTTTQDIVFNGGNFQSANEIMRLKGTGNVGIGTTTPAAKLHILGTSGELLRLGYNSTNYFRFWLGSSGNFTFAPGVDLVNSTSFTDKDFNSILSVDSVNNYVGIGTTNPLAKLDISGTFQYSEDDSWVKGGTPTVKWIGKDTIEISKTGSSYFSVSPLARHRDFRAKVNFKTTNSTHWGIMFNAQDANPQDNNYAVILRNVNTVRVQKRSAGNQTYPVSEIATGVTHNDGNWHTLEVEVVGQFVTVDIDGNNVISQNINDSTFTSGMVGFTIYDGSVQFNQFSVQEINEKSLAKGLIIPEGNVGIGTTNPTMKLDMGNNGIRMNYSAVNNEDVVNKAYLNSALSATGANFWKLNGSNLYASTTSWNVGIGTTDPIAKLQVNNNWTSNPGGTNTIYLSSAGFAANNLAPQQIITSDSANLNPGAIIGLALHNNNTTAGAYSPMLVFSKREAGSSAYNSAIAAIGARTVTGSGASDSWIDGDLMFYTAPTSGSGLIERMRIAQNGNVGIGTTNPTNQLTVKNSNQNMGVNVGDIGSSGYAGIGFSNSTTDSSNYNLMGNGTSIWFNRASGGNINFREANGTNQLTILSGGNVGIGTTSPQSLLDVNGLIKMRTSLITQNEDVINKEYLDASLDAAQVDSNAGGENLLRNGDFEDGISNWEEAMTVSDISTLEPKSGAQHFARTNTGVWLFSSDFIPIDTSKTYKLEAWAKQPTDGGTMYLGTRCYDKNKNSVSAHPGSYDYWAASGKNVTSDWEYIVGYRSGEDASTSNYYAFHPGTAFCKVMFIVNYSNGGGTTYIDDIKLTEVGYNRERIMVGHDNSGMTDGKITFAHGTGSTQTSKTLALDFNYTNTRFISSSGAVAFSGTGNYSIDASNARIGNVAAPSDPLDAVNLSYLESTFDTIVGDNVGSGTTGQTLRHNGTSWVANSILNNNGSIIGIGAAATTGNMLDISSTQGSAGNSAIRALYPAGGGLANTEFAALANRESQWNAVYAKQGSASAALYTDGEVNMMNGNVGIGADSPNGKLEIRTQQTSNTTSFSSPHLKLSASSVSDNTGATVITLGTSVADNYGISLVGLRAGTGGAPDFSIKTHNNSSAGVERFRLTALGNVGIGTTTPQAKLEVNGTFKVAGALNSVVMENLGGGGNRIVMTTDEGGLYATSTSAATGLPDGTANGQTLRYDGSAWVPNTALYNNGTNVGIGTTNPRSTLHVNGGTLLADNIQSQGTFTAGDETGSGNTVYVGDLYKNVVHYSESTTNWIAGAGGAVAMDNTITNPSGGLGVIKITTGALVRKTINSNNNFQNSGNFVVSFWIRKDTGSKTGVYIDTNDRALATQAFDIDTNWRRVVIYAPAHAVYNGSLNFFDINNITTGEIYYIWGVQVESGDTVTPYQKTEAYSAGKEYGLWASAGGFGGTTKNPSTVIKNNGLHFLTNVGIGNTNPTEKLEVSGNIKLNTNGTNVVFSTYKGANSDGYNVYVGGGLNSIGQVGSTWLGSYNTAFGFDAFATNTTGYSNSAFGWEALNDNTEGHNNAAFGLSALTSNTTGYYNTAFGAFALRYNINGIYNSAQGFASLQDNTSGSRNTAQGNDALRKNTTASDNTAQGYAALFYNTTGANNTAQGAFALVNNTTSSQNTALGANAGRYIASGANNQTSANSLFLGYNTRPAAAGQTNQIVIGYNAIGLGSNSAVLGNTSITKTYLRGDVAIATTTQAARLDVAGGNVFIHDWNITSATPKAAVTREYLDSVLTALPSGISHYVTSTPVTYNGNQGGYSAVNAMCDALVTGSHVCTAEEILQTINSGNSASIPNSTTLWINNGPPGYTTNANDCIGWTNAASTSFAPVWVKLASGDGFGALERCNASRSYACCK